MKVQIDVESLRDLQRYLAGMGNRVTDFSVPLTDGAKLMKRDILYAIASAGASWGDPWKEMAETTEERWGAHPLLNLTGELIADIHYFVRPLVAGVGTRNPVATLHEYGRDWPNADGHLEMPPRTYIAFDEATIDLMVEMCLDYAIEENARMAA